jgi:hypothetical protein
MLYDKQIHKQESHCHPRNPQNSSFSNCHSVSILSWDSKPLEEGAFEELGRSASIADGSVLLAKSMGKGLCLGQLQDFSALYPSFSSFASYDYKPYNIFYFPYSNWLVEQFLLNKSKATSKEKLDHENKKLNENCNDSMDDDEN